jgi:peptidyl-prolyl cis-trans isomerase A (cyclophilin A)
MPRLIPLLLCLVATASPAQDLLVSSRFSDNVLRFGLDGTSKGVFAQGNGLDNPNGIAYGPDGHLYVGLGDVGRVMVFDGATGAYLRDFVSPATPGGLRGCRAIAFLPDGDLLVDAGPNDQVLRYRAGSGAFAGVFAADPALRGPVGLRVGPDGSVYVGAALSNNVLVYAPDGTLRRTLPMPAGHSNATGVLLHPDGSLLVAQSVSNAVLKLDPQTGAGAAFASGGGLAIPIDLIFHPNGELLVGSFQTDRILRYDGRTGAPLGDFVAGGAGGLDGTHNFAFMPAPPAAAPRVLLDTDRGPVLLELDPVRAPRSSANFLAYLDAGHYAGTLVDRVGSELLEAGRVREDGTPVARAGVIAAERGTGLRNLAGTLAAAPDGDAANTAAGFVINLADAPQRDATHAPFGHVVFGFATLAEMATTPRLAGSAQPIRPPRIAAARRVAPGRFPILPLHTGAGYDPLNSGRGFQLQVAHAAGGESGPLLVAFWYDYFEGRQLWASGVKPFAWGDAEVVLPMALTRGPGFGSAFDPAQVVTESDWGTLTVSFEGCEHGTFRYATRYGSGSAPVRSLTLPPEARCRGG